MFPILYFIPGSACGDPFSVHQSQQSSSNSFNGRRFSRRQANPVILTKSKTFRVPEGQSVTLPCDVQNLGKFSL